jgi:transketolase
MKLRNETNKVFVLMGDGEMQEGSVWEAAMLAPKLGLNNLVALIDRNNLQGYGRATELVQFYPIEEKWISFGWDAVTVDGHDEAAIAQACKTNDKPKVVICDTTKGKGVSFMEDELKWHYFLVQDDHKAQAMEELK